MEVADTMSDEEMEVFVDNKKRELEQLLAQPRAKPLSEVDPESGDVVEPIVAWGAAWGTMTDLPTYAASLDVADNSTLTTYHLLLKEADEAMYAQKKKLKATGLVANRPGSPEDDAPNPVMEALIERIKVATANIRDMNNNSSEHQTYTDA